MCVILCSGNAEFDRRQLDSGQGGVYSYIQHTDEILRYNDGKLILIRLKEFLNEFLFKQSMVLYLCVVYIYMINGLLRNDNRMYILYECK